MELKTPQLDDRTFADLVEEARARISLYTPEWTDHNLSDPGITLIELFAWMMDILLYRLNRVPDKHFIKFMELIGMRLHEAEPARAPVTFWLIAPQPNPVTIPTGTEVATVRTETEAAIIFTTDGPLEVRLPVLSHVLTSTEGREGRVFIEHNVRAVQEGYASFAVFASEPPTGNDALYLGFEQDLSQHILGVELEVDEAQGAGVNPEHPPYVWEVVGTGLSEKEARLRVDVDGTRGLNVSGLIRIHLPDMQRSERNGHMAYWVRCRLDLTNIENPYQVSPKINRVRVSTWGGTIGATNVTRVREEVLGRSDGTPGQRFYLEHRPLLARTSDEYLEMHLEDGRVEHWQEVSDFSSSTLSDRHYTIDSDSGEVRLGPALLQPDGQVQRYGALAPKGAMLMMKGYRYGGGLAGNVAANQLVVLKTGLPYIERVANLQPAQGGKDAESLENAKMRVPGHLRSLGRAVTSSDFEYLAREAAPGEVGRAHCLQPPMTNPGEIRVLVIPSIARPRDMIDPGNLELSDELRETIMAYLDERRLLSTRLEVAQPAYQWVETEVRLRVAQYYDPEKVRAAVNARLVEFINPLVGGMDGDGWPFGRDLFVSDVMAALQTVPGVHFVRSVKFYPVTRDRQQYTRGAEVSEIRLPVHGVVVCAQNVVVTE
jgi:predicted phage baseplate assembly protein